MENQNCFGIAYFISPHGFGHAARASAIMASLRHIDPSIHLHVFTTVPQWFFADSLSKNFEYHSLLTDIGLSQTSPFIADIPKTVRQLDQFLPFDPKVVHSTAQTLQEKGCRLVVCDIAPLGIAVAEKTRVPSVLVENFTWDWIYESYLSENGGLKRPIAYLRDLFWRADYHIQTEPVCNPCDAHLSTAPVSRKPKTPAPLLKAQLGIPEDAKVVLITLGGIPEKIPYSERLVDLDHIQFILPGSNKAVERWGNILHLPQHSAFFHPDLVDASDAVIGKVGYSTLSEIYNAGIPFGYISRNTFRESRSLVSYVEAYMQGVPVEEDDLYNGQWTFVLPKLLQYPKIAPSNINGADQAAAFIHNLL
jgi:hypothetical protein